MARASIAHVVLSLDPGGAEKLVLDLATRCARRVPTRVYCLDRAGEWAPQLTGAGIPVVVVGRRPGFDLRVAARLRRLARRDGVTVLHCHQYTPFVYGALASLPRTFRIVFTEHGRLSDALPSPRRAAVNRILGHLPAVTAAVSAELREFMLREGFSPRQVVVIPNGIDPGPEPSASARALARESIGVGNSEFVVGTAARLDHVKNLPMALEAFADLKAHVPHAVFVVIGDGPERQSLSECPAALRAGDAIRWLGYREDVRRLLPAFDVYLNTSVSEGVSVTILEAMAAGVPVVATAVGGTPEVVVSGRTGFLVGSRDVHACAAALERLAGDATLRCQSGSAGRERLIGHFDADQMVGRYLAAYGIA
jgi:glycosyltransferase involved in cell wall biosynthesis